MGPRHHLIWDWRNARWYSRFRLRVRAGDILFGVRLVLAEVLHHRHGHPAKDRHHEEAKAHTPMVMNYSFAVGVYSTNSPVGEGKKPGTISTSPLSIYIEMNASLIARLSRILRVWPLSGGGALVDVKGAGRGVS